MDDKSLGPGGHLIRWVQTPRCTECGYRDRANNRCRLQRCRFRDKQPDKVVMPPMPARDPQGRQ